MVLATTLGAGIPTSRRKGRLNSVIASACFFCHDSATAQTHVANDGSGAIYEARTTALTKSERCPDCHAAGIASPIKTKHKQSVRFSSECGSPRFSQNQPISNTAGSGNAARRFSFPESIQVCCRSISAQLVSVSLVITKSTAKMPHWICVVVHFQETTRGDETVASPPNPFSF